jgi:hypothetical protein
VRCARCHTPATVEFPPFLRLPATTHSVLYLAPPPTGKGLKWTAEAPKFMIPCRAFMDTPRFFYCLTAIV